MHRGDDRFELLTLCACKGVDWRVLAREAQRPGGLGRLREGTVSEASRVGRETAKALRAARTNSDDRAIWVEKQLTLADAAGARLVTVLDDDYPLNLRLIFNLPPFLFWRGTLRPDDARSVAVVGTRQATVEGVRQAGEMARALTELEVTVASGLAKGIDTAAHEATLAAGGRTLAVIGTGILRCYPAENRALAERIAENGAVVSQFWPDSAPTRSSFPMRNVTMSGITQGSVVIEASATSGAKMQARLALEHGKRVFLIESLVTNQRWAQEYLKRPGAVAVRSAAEVVNLLKSSEAIQELTSLRRQLVMELA